MRIIGLSTTTANNSNNAVAAAGIEKNSVNCLIAASADGQIEICQRIFREIKTRISS